MALLIKSLPLVKSQGQRLGKKSLPGAKTREKSLPGAQTREKSLPGAKTREKSLPGAKTREKSLPGAKTLIQIAYRYIEDFWYHVENLV